MITELTKEHEALMLVVRDEWLAKGLAIATKINKKAAREAVVQSYKCAKLPPPKQQYIYFGRSPYEGALIVAICQDLWQNQNKTVPTWKRVQPLLEQYTKLLGDTTVRSSLPEPIKKLAKDAFQAACYGQHDAGWLAVYDFFKRIGVKDLEQLDGLKNAAKYCGWWWPMTEIAVITQMPVALHLDTEGRQHSENSMSIEYSDQRGLYCWHGIHVPKNIIMEPGSITTQNVIDEENVEIRRIMIERMGEDLFLEQADSKLIHEDQYGKLWRIELPGGDPWIAVEVINATPEPDGTSRKYVLSVPSDIKTAHAAVAWTFYSTPEEYAPVQQT